tara:strand:- start:273 stop:482 length:210 start_codon:yes stop_codon:yes gene_type:complete
MSKLVLTRKENNNNNENSSIIVHDKGNVFLTITVIKINGKQVRLSLESENDSVSIDRKEVFQRKYDGEE